MLKTNTKIVRERIMNYILENSIDYLTEYGDGLAGYDLTTNNGVCAAIYKAFTIEKGYELKRRSAPIQRIFEDWARGLACGSLFDFWCYGNTVDLLGEILEETDDEKAKYNDEKACELLTYLIYREITKRK